MAVPSHSGGNVTVTSSTIARCTAGDYGRGGAISADGYVTVTSSTITGEISRR